MLKFTVLSKDCLVETWKKSPYKKENADAIPTDLSKTFDSLNHELLIAKLNPYILILTLNFEDSVLKLLLNYFDNRTQCVKINNEFSLWMEIK